MKKVATVVALGALRICTDNPNDLFGTNGDGKGQDTLFGLGAGGELAGSLGDDRLEGNDGNDTPDGGIGEDRRLCQLQRADQLQDHIRREPGPARALS